MSATNRGAKRRDRDFYETPAWCTEAIVKEMAWGYEPSVWEPAAGSGAIADVIKRSVPHACVKSTDIAPQSCSVEQGDFFTDFEFRSKWDFIITNPPFSLAQEFIDRSLDLANCVVMLLPLSFMGSKKRRDWWRARPYTAIHYLSQRPSFTGDGKTDAECYAWVVWDKTDRQKKGCYWL